MWVIARTVTQRGTHHRVTLYWSSIMSWTRDKSKAIQVEDRFRIHWALNHDETWEKAEVIPLLESDEEEACFT